MAGKNRTNKAAGDDFSAAMSQRAYAAHRGCALRAVQEAIENGRLKDSVIWGDWRGKPAARIRDVALADAEWERNTDHTMRLHGSAGPGAAKPAAKKPAAQAKRPAGGAGPRIIDPPKAPPPHRDDPDDEGMDADIHDGMTFSDANRVEKIWKARQAKLDYEKKAGLLAPVAEFKAAMETIVTTSRTKLLALPSKAKQRLPHLTRADIDVLEQLLRESLEELCQQD